MTTESHSDTTTLGAEQAQEFAKILKSLSKEDIDSLKEHKAFVGQVDEDRVFLLELKGEGEFAKLEDVLDAVHIQVMAEKAFNHSFLRLPRQSRQPR